MKTILWALGLIVLIAVMIAGSYTFYRYQVSDAVKDAVKLANRQRLMAAADRAYEKHQQANQQKLERAEIDRRLEQDLELIEYVVEREQAECNRRLERQLAEIERD